MKSQQGSCFHVSLLVRRFIFCVRFTNQREHCAIDSRAWFDDVRNNSFFAFFIKIFERLFALILMLLQIVISSICDAFEFLATKGKIVFDVVSPFGIKRALFIRHIAHV